MGYCEVEVMPWRACTPSLGVLIHGIFAEHPEIDIFAGRSKNMQQVIAARFGAHRGVVIGRGAAANVGAYRNAVGI